VGPPGHEHRSLDEVLILFAVTAESFTSAPFVLWGDRTFLDIELRRISS